MAASASVDTTLMRRILQQVAVDDHLSLDPFTRNDFVEHYTK